MKNIFSVERLDYSKGLPERFLAYETLLEKYPQHHGKIRYTQIAPTSRGDVQAYQDIRHQLETAAGRINGQFGQLGWTPLYYLNQHFDRKLLMKVFRYSDVGLSDATRWMNLVAKRSTSRRRIRITLAYWSCRSLRGGAGADQRPDRQSLRSRRGCRRAGSRAQHAAGGTYRPSFSDAGRDQRK